MNQNKIIYPQEMMDNIAKEKKRTELEDKICWVVLFIIGAYIMSLLIDQLIILVIK